MNIVVLLASDIKNDAVAAAIAKTADLLVAADGGADHADRLGLVPDILAGDFDSVDRDVLRRFRAKGVRLAQVPAAKNETDAELVIRLALEEAAAGADGTRLYVLGGTGGRLDHELGNLLHLARYAEIGHDVRLSDGETLVALLHGPCRATLDWPPAYGEARPWYVSAVALRGDVTGLTYEGLAYGLNNFTLPFGSTRGVSNETTDPADVRFSVSCRTGLLAVIVTPRR